MALLSELENAVLKAESCLEIAESPQAGAPALNALLAAWDELELVLGNLLQKSNYLRDMLLNQRLGHDFPLFHEMRYVETQTRLFPAAHQKLYLRAAKCFQRHGRAELAFKLLADLLRERPDMEQTRLQLKELELSGLPKAEEAGELLRATHFELVETISRAELKYPFCACFDDGCSRLFISDLKSAKIHCFFTRDGSYQAFAGPYASTWGIAWGFQRLFICDHKAGGLYCLDPQSGVAQRIELEKLSSGKIGDLAPESVCVCGPRVYLLLSKTRLRDALVVSFAYTDKPEDFQIHPNLPDNLTVLAAPQGNEFCACAMIPPVIYKLAPGTREPSVFARPSLDFLYNMAGFDGDYFITNTNGVCRIDREGKLVGSFSLQQVLYKMIVYQGIAVQPDKEGAYLYLADFVNLQIHKVRVLRRVPLNA